VVRFGIQGRLSNICYKYCWIRSKRRPLKLLLIARAQTLCRSGGVGKVSLLMQGEVDISVVKQIGWFSTSGHVNEKVNWSLCLSISLVTKTKANS